MKNIPFLLIALCSFSFSTQADWKLTLWVDAGTQYKLTIGMDSSATTGFNAKIDFPAPPIPPTGFFPYFPCKDSKYSYIQALWGDVRAIADSAQWTMRLHNASVPVVIEWSVDSLPAGFLNIEGKLMRDLNGKYKVPANDTLITFEFMKNFSPANVLTLTNIKFTLEAEADVKITITDKDGSVIDILSPGKLPAGDNSFNWNGATKAGFYFYSVEAGGKRIATGRILSIGSK